jgi:hypothetical protein
MMRVDTVIWVVTRVLLFAVTQAGGDARLKTTEEALASLTPTDKQVGVCVLLERLCGAEPQLLMCSCALTVPTYVWLDGDTSVQCASVTSAPGAQHDHCMYPTSW